MAGKPRKRTWAGVATLAAALLVAYLNGGVAGVLGAAGELARELQPAAGEPAPRSADDAADRDAGHAIARLFDARISGEMVEGNGRVRATLSDDRRGSRHQRFLLEFANGHSLLVSHNIDLAPRIDSLARGDRVEFRGQYEWNEKGGVLHWTHHDPDRRRPGGWLRHDGATYR